MSFYNLKFFVLSPLLTSTNSVASQTPALLSKMGLNPFVLDHLILIIQLDREPNVKTLCFVPPANFRSKHACLLWNGQQ